MARGRENSLRRMTRIAHDACMSTTGETATGEAAGHAVMAHTGVAP
ncbi:hypothetical protein SALBM311S_05847 [Streptomyces alboniger]